MENPWFDPFFQNCWTAPPPPPRRGVPVTPSPWRQTPKVVPVQFIGGLEKKRFNAAVKIQKVFRGFWVRKSMEKLLRIKTEVDEIERKLSQDETIGLISNNNTERLKMNEILMRLLLRLDLIRGVRDARKSIIRKTIMLQDGVDKLTKRFNSSLKIQKVLRGFLVRKSMKKIVVINTEVDEIGRKLSEDEMIGLICSNTNERLKMNEMLMRLLLRLDSVRSVVSGVRDARKSVISKVIMLQDRIDTIGDLSRTAENAGDQVLEDAKECKGPSDACEDMDIDQCVEEVLKPVGAEVTDGNSIATSPETFNMAVEEEHLVEPIEEEEHSVEPIEEGWEEIPGKEEIKETVMEIQQQKMVKDDTRDMMARMVEENQKLTQLVAELCRNNALQTEMITSLSQRVESLEKAYKKEKLRRRNKKMEDAANY